MASLTLLLPPSLVILNTIVMLDILTNSFRGYYASRPPSKIEISEVEPELVVKNSHRGHYMGITFIVCMMLLTAGLGYLTFYFFRGLETKLFETQFIGSSELLRKAITTDFQNTDDAGSIIYHSLFSML